LPLRTGRWVVERNAKEEPRSEYPARKVKGIRF
jgi:hypothetical protein